MRGRVMAVENVFIGASNELGAFESGVAGSLIGVGPAVWVGGVPDARRRRCCGAFVFPGLRDIDRFDDVTRRRTTSTHRGPPVWLTLAVAGEASDANR